MSTQHTIRVPRVDVAAEKLGFFDTAVSGGAYCLPMMRENGMPYRMKIFAHFWPERWMRIILNMLDSKKGFLRSDLDVEHLAEKVRTKKKFLGLGPHLHVMITTLRCNQSCKYCHASRTSMDRIDTDMSLDTAKKAVDLAMQSTSPYINLSFRAANPR